MNETLEQQILKEAKALNPDISDAMVTELSIFLSSEENKSELNSTSLKQLSGKILKALITTDKEDED